MRVVCLWFPRLGVQLALRQRPALAGRPVMVLQGHGDEALVAEVSCEAAAARVLRGMSAGQARGRCPGSVFLPDTATACLDELERMATMIASRATDHVAIGGRDHLFVETVAGVPERDLGLRLASLAAAWSGLGVQAGIAATRQEALEAARAARGRVLVVAGDDDGERVPPWRPEPLVASARLETDGELGARAALQRLLARLETIREARGESYRRAIITIRGPAGELRFRCSPPSPLHDARALFPLILARVDAATLGAATAVDVRLEGPGPEVRVRPCRAALGGGRPVEGRQLVRAS